MKTLKKISPSPIAEAVTEIRFDGDLASEVIFGKLYAPLSKDFGETEQLPILEVPNELRNRPELKYAPHYRLKNDRFVINIGPRIISINRICTEHEYSSWSDYSKVIKQVLGEVKNIGLISEASRVGVRYINFFEKPITEVLNLKINLFQGEAVYEEMAMSLLQELKNDKKLKTDIKTNGQLNNSKRFKDKGLLANFEAYKEVPVKIDDIFNVVDDLHKEVKQAFTSALDEDFLKTLSPEYAQ